MIIVKTKNGARFVNEKQSVMVNHNKEEKQVEVVCRDGSDIINEVESVTYITDAQPMSWKEDGSEVVQQKEKYEELKESYESVHNMCIKQRNIIEEYSLSVSRLSPYAKKWDFLKAELERLDNSVRNRYPEFNVAYGHDEIKSEK